MKKNDFDAAYWTHRYENNQIEWDIGYPSTPLKSYIDQIKDKNQKILIPGCGNGYEAEYAFKKGFDNIYIADISKPPLMDFKRRVPHFPNDQLIQNDFFEIKDTFDLILEQTFFCALHPSLRKDYVNKMAALLNPRGKLAGVLFDFPMNTSGPPFGGNKKLYKTYFKETFFIRTLEHCDQSIPERKDKELFFIFEKK